MERLARLGKETALGGAVLLWVLGAPTAAHATPYIFNGDFTLCHPCTNTHPDICLEFAGHDETHSCVTCPIPAAVAHVTGLPTSGSCPAPETFQFTGCVPAGHCCDTWQLQLEGYQFCGTGGFLSPQCGTDTFCSGTFSFVPSESGCPPPNVCCNGVFRFHNIDAITVTEGQVVSFGPAVAAAPEVDASALENPLALALAVLLALSDPRRKQQDA